MGLVTIYSSLMREATKKMSAGDFTPLGTVSLAKMPNGRRGVARITAFRRTLPLTVELCLLDEFVCLLGTDSRIKRTFYS